MPEDSFSDHRKIPFIMKQDKRPSLRCRSNKRTNWNTYELELSAKVLLWIGRVETPADIEREWTKINSATTSSLHTACPERRCSGNVKIPWWNHELKRLRQKANKAFHTAYQTRLDRDWDLHRAAGRAF